MLLFKLRKRSELSSRTTNCSIMASLLHLRMILSRHEFIFLMKLLIWLHCMLRASILHPILLYAMAPLLLPSSRLIMKFRLLEL